MIQTWTTRPEVLEAVLFDGQNGPEVAKWCGGHYYAEADSPYVDVPRLGGAFSLDEGEYLIKNPDTGRFNRMSKAEFEAKYVVQPPKLTPRESWEGFTTPLSPTIKNRSVTELNGVDWSMTETSIQH
jgi:hypothetical protein